MKCQHEPDPRSIAPADGTGRNQGSDWIVDVNCRKCGRSGSVRIDPTEIDFDDDPLAFDEGADGSNAARELGELDEDEA